jgi:hypothetical protein
MINGFLIFSSGECEPALNMLIDLGILFIEDFV